MRPNSTLILATVQASSADVALANGVMTIGNSTDGYLTPIYTRDLIANGAQKFAYVAGTANVRTVTITTPAANTSYFLQVTGANGKFARYLYPALTTAPTLAQVRTFFVNCLTNDASYLGLTVSGSSPDIILTANNAPYNILTVTSSFSVANTTAGVSAVGTIAQVLEAWGVVVTGASGYTAYLFNYPKYSTDTNIGVSGDVRNSALLLINLADADSTALIATLDNLIDGLDSAGTVANNEFISARG